MHYVSLLQDSNAQAPPDPWLKFGIVALIVVVGAGVFVKSAKMFRNLPDQSDFEVRKIRFAAATFTGVLLLLLLAAVFSFLDPVKGAPIFDKAITAMSPIAGGIIGYFFAAHEGKKSGRSEQQSSGDEPKASSRG